MTSKLGSAVTKLQELHKRLDVVAKILVTCHSQVQSEVFGRFEDCGGWRD